MDPWIVAYSLAAVLGAAVVRGYSGFGFSLLAITALSLVLTPREIVPSIFLLEIAASLHLLPGIWRDIHWRSIGPLLLGCAAGTLAGVWVLKTADPSAMKIALAVFVIVAAVLLGRGFALKRLPGTPATLAAGAASGLLNGAFGIGGPPVILFYFGSPAATAISRASIIAYFLGTDVMGLMALAYEDLIDRQNLWRFLLFLPPLLLGVWIGARGFKSADPAAFRRWVLRLLIVLAVLTALEGARGLLYG